MSRLVDDRTLREAFRRGEPEALAEVYREYCRPLFAFLAGGFEFDSGGKRVFFKGLTEAWARDEAVQEVFARAFAEAARLAYDGLRPYRNYLFTIARNYLIDLARGRRRESLVVEGPEVAEAPPSTGAEEIAGSRELTALCEAFVQALAPAERAVFDARFRQGLSIALAARQAGLTEHRVKRCEAAVRKRFFLLLKQHGYFDGFGYGQAGVRRSPLPLVVLLLLGVRP